MGTLRTLFAIAVVFAHSSGNLLVGGQNAVQLFYMISGFLISYVLVERKAYPNVKSFYINRYLRLYPIYFAIATLALIAFTLASNIGIDKNFFNIYSRAPNSADILLVVSNLTLFFQDWVMFSGVEQNRLVFVTNFFRSEVVLYQGLLVPQAWTLGVELTFYLLAPFILLKKRLLIALLVSSLLLRAYLISIGLGTRDPWTYRFFPTELAFFLLGALAHQVLLPIYQKKLNAAQIEKYSKISTYFLVLLTLVFSLIPINEIKKSVALFGVFLLLMPLAFIFQSNRKWDKWIGDLSYPIYISHMLVIYVATFFISEIVPTENRIVMGVSTSLDKIAIGLSAVIFSMGLAILLNKFVGTPTEQLRNKFRVAN
jgi:peptidoglycan/LPS O-acetylase OafA/YrhL